MFARISFLVLVVLTLLEEPAVSTAGEGLANGSAAARIQQADPNSSIPMSAKDKFKSLFQSSLISSSGAPWGGPHINNTNWPLTPWLAALHGNPKKELWRLGFQYPFYCGPEQQWESRPSPLCSLYAAPILLGARFGGELSYDPSAPSMVTPQGLNVPYTTDEQVPWMMVDHVVRRQKTQLAPSVAKAVLGEAQLDLFLCSDSNCSVSADIRYIFGMSTPGEGASHAKLKQDTCPTPLVGPSTPMRLACLYPCTWTEQARVAQQKRPVTRRVLVFRGLTSSNVAITHNTISKRNISSGTRSIYSCDPMEAKVKQGDLSEFHDKYQVSWQEDSDSWANNSDAGSPAFVPTEVAMRLQVKNTWSTPYAGPWAFPDGMGSLQYGTFHVQDMFSGWQGCANVVLPPSDGGWMDQHGWNLSDPTCANASLTYVFDSYYPQAVLTQKHWGSVGRVQVDWPRCNCTAPAYKDPTCSYSACDAVLDSTSLLPDDKTWGLAFPSNKPPKLPGATDFDVYADEGYGVNLGVASFIGPTAYDNQPTEPVFFMGTHGDSCRKNPACSLLKIGSAYVGAWSLSNVTDPSSVQQALSSLLHFPVLGCPDGIPFYPWCATEYEQNRRDVCGVFLPQLLDSCYLQSGKARPICDGFLLNCSHWDALGVGFAHAGKHKSMLKPLGKFTELLGAIHWYPLDDPHYTFPMLGFGPVNPKDVETAVHQVEYAADASLIRYIDAQMIAADATKTWQGALVDTILLVVAIVAIASAIEDIQGLVDRSSRWSMRKVTFCVALVRERFTCQGNASIVCGAQLCVHPTWGLVSIAHRVWAFISRMTVKWWAPVWTCMIVLLSLVVAPILALITEQNARRNNPSGDDTKVTWLSSSTGAGAGPYLVVGAMTLKAQSVYSSAAYKIVCVNLAWACLACFILWCRVVRRCWRSGTHLADMSRSELVAKTAAQCATVAATLASTAAQRAASEAQKAANTAAAIAASAPIAQPTAQPAV